MRESKHRESAPSMSSQKVRLRPDEIDSRLRTAGSAGCGGAGFPSYAKWQELEDVDSLLVNHQESEPIFYTDKWLLESHAAEFADLFETLCESVLERVVIGAKHKDRERWMAGFEEATDATVYLPGDLPFEIEDEEGVVIAYTEDRFQYGMETCLLSLTAGTRIGDDLPGDYGWVVHNTETLYNVYRALVDGTPVTRKYVQVGGDVPRHRFLSVPVGTRGPALLEAAGASVGDLTEDQTLIEGGPGWGFELDQPLESFAVSKSTNGLVVADADVVEENTFDGGRVNLLDAVDWDDGSHETEPATFHPDRVRIPLITNDDYEGLVDPGDPVVDPGDSVSEGDVVAEPGADGISLPQHASIDGTVTDVTGTYVEIERPG